MAGSLAVHLRWRACANICVCSLICDGGLSSPVYGCEILEGVRTQTGVKSNEAPDELARETRMVKPKSYECLL